MKTVFYCIAILVFFSACKSNTGIANANSKKKEKTNSGLAESIVASALQNLGIGYKTAGTTKAGYDCSGLVFTVYGNHNIQLPRTSLQQSKTGLFLGTDISKAKKGDLIFFRTNNQSPINHVGIVTAVEDQELIFVHSSTSKGVILSSTKQPYYKKTFAQVNRVVF
ncbi:C40 family peptidase [Flavobacterium crassostreae]|uniref:Glycoside hydrolase n=1 Tax=Flavobacterium crassostreae TaxID=1763534 RepID=A0A1B9DZS7_9FLAO|nr:C40 family peptidase [Flavobacterium crassostreae]OCB75202.1 glycoside hydrolase [Flavobacterium crassostreae]